MLLIKGLQLISNVYKFVKFQTQITKVCSNKNIFFVPFLSFFLQWLSIILISHLLYKNNSFE